MIEFFPDEDPYRTFDGKRRVPFGYYSGQVCLSAPDALDRAVQHAVAQVDRSRRAGYPTTSVGFWNEDNYLVCVCPGCTAPITLDDGASVVEAATENFAALTKLGGRLLGAEMAYVGSAKKPVAAMNGWLLTRASWNADVREVAKLRKYYIRPRRAVEGSSTRSTSPSDANAPLVS